jgi:hypothetical protein
MAKIIEISKRDYDLKHIDDTNIDDYNFGDIIISSYYKFFDSYIIGKNGELIKNPDNSKSGYLSIPFEITQYMDDAVEFYENIDYNDIDLSSDDGFILRNIGRLPKSYKINYTPYISLITIFFPDGKISEFELGKLSPHIIKRTYEMLAEEQSKFKLFVDLKDGDYDNFENKYGSLIRTPKIHYAWKIDDNNSGGGINHFYKIMTFYGPKKYEDRVKKSIKLFYKNFNYKIIL